MPSNSKSVTAHSVHRYFPSLPRPLLTFLGLGHSPSTSSWSTRPFLQCLAQMLLNLQNTLHRPRHGKPFFSTNVQCVACISLCVNTFSVSMFILFSSVHRPLAPRSLRAASWPGLPCRAPCSGKAPGNGAVTVPNDRVLLRSQVPGLCSHSAWLLSGSESSAWHRGPFHRSPFNELIHKGDPLLLWDRNPVPVK